MKAPVAPPALRTGPVIADVVLIDDAAAADLGRLIARELEAGDVVALSGAIGAGKTTLARAILRDFLADPETEAPSPTFTLLQTYEGERGQLVHADLYRIRHEAELVEVGFEDLQVGGVLLVEWPERAGALLRPDRLEVALSVEPGGGRRAVLTGEGPLVGRLERASALARVLQASGWAEAERTRMQGDASTRAYERLTKPDGETAILMISPPRPDGPPVRRGRPYSALARLAETVHAFAAMDRGLIAQGYSAPVIYGEDLDVGLLVIEDLGQEPVVTADGAPMPERYEEAVRLLADLHARDLPHALPVTGEDGARPYTLPPYDLEALMIEAELLLDWYRPHVAGTTPSGSVRAEFGHLWRAALTPVIEAPATWTLRDYHSPNLIWLPERSGLGRVGVLDFQDAVLGHPAYDVASLLQDARVTVPAELELHLLGAYASARKALQPEFDIPAFAAAYAVLGAQRATKILGIFARLNRRDGKPGYLRHIPRVRGYLQRNLAHPALERLAGWYAAQMPGEFAQPATGGAAA